MNRTRIFKRSAAAVTAMALSIPVFSYDNFGAQAALSNAEKVVEYAKTKTYITSRPNEVTNFYGLVCDWCSMFVYYCAYKNGVGDAVPNTTFCDSQYGYKGGVEIFKSWGRWEYSSAKGGSYTPVTGDVIYYDWNLDGYSDHVGFVDKVSGGYVYTVEGNSGTYGDCVKLNRYSLSYANILGYGRPDYGDGKKSVQTVSAPKAAVSTTAVSAKKSAATTTAAAQKKNVKLPSVFKVSSSVGAWLRESADSSGDKLGVISTGRLVTADKISGDWVHISSVELEGGKNCSGWVALSTLSFVINIAAVPETATTTAVTTTASASTTVKVTTTVTAAAQAVPVSMKLITPAVEVRSAEEHCAVYRVDSPVGAWFRSSANTGSGNTLGIVDTDQLIYVLDTDGEWACAKASLDGGKSYVKGYIHLSTIVPDDLGSGGGTYKVTSAIGCRLRKAPDVEADNTLAILDTGDRLSVAGISGDWAFVETGSGMYGFVHTSNISRG